MTFAELSERVKQQLAREGVPEAKVRVADLKIKAAFDVAAHAFARACAMDPAKRGFQSQDYSLTIGSDGSAALTATGSITGAADIVGDTIAFGTVADADGNLLSYVPDYAAFRYQAPTTLLALYSLRNGSLYAATAGTSDDSRYTAYSGNTITVNACWSPAVSTLSYLKSELEDDLVSKVVEVFMRQALPEA